MKAKDLVLGGICIPVVEALNHHNLEEPVKVLQKVEDSGGKHHFIKAPTGEHIEVSDEMEVIQIEI